MQTTDYEMDKALDAVEIALARMVENGIDEQRVGNAMMSHALRVMGKVRSQQDVARHLYLLAMMLAKPDEATVSEGVRH